MNIMDKSLNTMEKNNEKGNAGRKSKTLSEMDENNGKMNVTWVKPMENIDENHEGIDKHRVKIIENHSEIDERLPKLNENHSEIWEMKDFNFQAGKHHQKKLLL